MRLSKVLCILFIIITLTACTKTKSIDNDQEYVDYLSEIEEYVENKNMEIRGNEILDKYYVELLESRDEYGILFYEKNSKDGNIVTFTFEKIEDRYQVNYISYDNINFAILSINDEELRGTFDKVVVEINDREASPHQIDLYTNQYIMLFNNINIKTKEDRFKLSKIEFFDDRNRVIREKIELKVNEEKSIDVFKIDDIPKGFKAMDIELHNGEKIFIKGNDVNYYSDICDGIIIYSEDSYYKLNASMPTIPEVNKNNDKFIYVDVNGFEVIGNLYMYTSQNQSIIKLTDMIYHGGISIYGDDFKDNTIRDIEWINDNNILLVIGYAHGTVSEGGDLYVYNIKNGNLKRVLEAEENTEILKVSNQTNTIKVKIKHWTDDNYINYEVKEEVLDYDILGF